MGTGVKKVIAKSVCCSLILKIGKEKDGKHSSLSSTSADQEKIKLQKPPTRATSAGKKKAAWKGSARKEKSNPTTIAPSAARSVYFAAVVCFSPKTPNPLQNEVFKTDRRKIKMQI